MNERIRIERGDRPRPRPADAELGFGKYFADHMFVADYDARTGWREPRIVPYAPLSLEPAAAIFHYGQAMFEGSKAFRGADGKIRLFRVDRHAARLNDGAKRLCIPAPEPRFLEEAFTELVRTDASWVPRSAGTALYLRPTLIATEAFLGVRPSTKYLFFVISSPVGAYYAEGGLGPVSIWVEEELTRAARGGLGAVKAGANYAASLLAAERAKSHGYAQVLWLDAQEHKYLEEVGTMNLFVRIGDELVTPPLEGSILAGVTRDCVLTLAKDWGIRAVERPIAIDELVAAHRRGDLAEVFGSGTAAVISPVGELGVRSERLRIGDGGVGSLAQRLYEAITSIQVGRAPDPHGWCRVVEGAA